MLKRNSMVIPVTALPQLSQCTQTKEIVETVKKNTSSNFTEENASSMNLQLSRNLSSFRGKLIPLINGTGAWTTGDR